MKVRLKPRQAVRPTVLALASTEERLGPRLHAAASGILYVVRSENGAIRLKIRPLPLFPEAADVDVTPDGSGDSEPYIGEDSRGTLIVAFVRAGGMWVTRSTDTGYTWSTPVLLIAGAVHPVVASGHDRSLVFAGVKDNRIWTAYQAPGALIPDEAVEAKLAGGNALPVADDTFDLAQAAGGLWILAARSPGSTSCKLWWSSDYCRTFTPVEE